MTEVALPTRDRVEAYFKELNNWGRWGHDDQLGTLNLITPAKQQEIKRVKHHDARRLVVQCLE